MTFSRQVSNCSQCTYIDQEDITTLMICDIPCRRTVEQVIDAINAYGFSGAYDLVYMPHQRGRRSPKNSQNVGYAFVNFKRPEFAASFMRVFQNVQFPNCASEKRSFAKPARFQGLRTNVDMHSSQRAAGCLLLF